MSEAENAGFNSASLANSAMELAKKGIEAENLKAIEFTNAIAAARTSLEAELAKATAASTAATLAKTGAEVEQAKALAASNAATTSKTNAEAEQAKALAAGVAVALAKTNADAELVKATVASTAAIAARAAAESEQAKSVEACTAAVAAGVTIEAELAKLTAASNAAVATKSGAEAEHIKASAASASAELARASAQAAQDIAEAASALAAVATATTERERDNAIAAKNLAVSAKTVAESGRDAAVTASEAAVAARVQAEADRDGAKKARVEAEAEAERAKEAHNMSTTVGLAGAFNEKAKEAKWRERFWAAILIGSLLTAGTIASIRYHDLTILIATRPDYWVLGADVFLAIFGISAPIWLAWMSTRMISKNFALTEDYAYKASISKAYLGFKHEAKNLDPIFEQRLFAAAITQLDANPVRFLDSEHPGSPLQDLLQQPFMREILRDDTIKQHLVDWFKERFGNKLSSFVKADAAPTSEVPKVSIANGSV